MGLFESDEMNLMLDKYSFKPGDAIRGAVSLSPKKPIKARKLEVALTGKIKTTHRDSDGDIHTEDKTVYDFTLPPDGEKEYLDGQYPFEIKIQPDILDRTRRVNNYRRNWKTNWEPLGLLLAK